MIRTRMFSPSAVALLCAALTAAARADELLEPIVPDDASYSTNDDEQASPRGIKAIAVGLQSQSTTSCAIPPADDCATADDGNWLTIPYPKFDSPCCHWVAGTEVTFLAPSFRGQSTSTTLTAPGAFINAGNNNSFNNLSYAPRIWIGKQGECWGFMTRFWYLSDSTAILNPIVANGTLAGNGSIDRLKAYTIDAEAQRMFTHCDGGRCFLTFGARCASYAADSSYNTLAVLGPDVATSYAAASSRFSGVGLTSAFYGYKPICCSDFSLFYNVRNSVVFGNSDSQAATYGTVQNVTPANVIAAGGANSNQASTLYIGEIQVGGQWNHQFQCIPLNGFFRAVGEYQYWNANSPLATSTSSATIGPTSAVAAAYAGRTNLSFVGFAIATGCTW